MLDLSEKERTCKRCSVPLPDDRRFLCVACDAAVDEMRTAREAIDKAERIDTVMRRSGLPVAYRDGERSMASVTDAAARRLAGSVLAGRARGMFLWGSAGVEKTTLAAATLALWIANGGTGLFVNIADLMSDVYATMGERQRITRSDVVDPLIETQMLVIDDLGKEKASDYAAGVLCQILDGRYRHMTTKSRRPLIITSNFDLTRLCNRFTADEIGEPINRRISEMTTALEMK